MTETPTNGLGKRISRYRKLAGLSAEQLAERAGEGLTRSIIANLENDRKRDVTVSQLLALAFVLGVSPVALVFDLLDPYGHSRLIDTETETVEAQNWMAYDWFGGGITPTELRVRRGGEDMGAPALPGDDTWTIHYLLSRRAGLLRALDAQSLKANEMETNARKGGWWDELKTDVAYQDFKSNIRDFSAELYSIDGQLRKFNVMIDKPITHAGSPF